MGEMELKEMIGSSSFAHMNVSTLLIEIPLVSWGCNPANMLADRDVCGVQAVLQSYSHDEGQTWTPLELTKDSKLYELGKPLFEQKGVARPIKW
jgi:hypothetical protein